MLAALTLGFLGSLHCVGMCGPLVLSMPFKNGNTNKWASASAYHFGRIFTYAAFGVLMGLFGEGLRYFFLQQWISIAAGVLLLCLYFLPRLINQKMFSSINQFWNRKVVVNIRKLLQPQAQQNSFSKFFMLGFFNGMLPCGLVYMALIGSISQTNLLGAVLFMVVFGLGTSPALTAIIFSKNWLLGNGRNYYNKVAPVLVTVVAALLILRGLGLGIPYISPCVGGTCCH